MANSPLRIIRSAYDLQREEGTEELLKQSFNYMRRITKDSLELECDGITVQFDTSSQIAKDWFYPRYLDGELHEPKITEEVINALSSDTVFYDVGANIGYYTVFASEVCTNGEVHAFELNPHFLHLARKSLNENGTRAILNNNAVSNSTGESVGYAGTFGKTSVDREDKHSDQQVESITLDSYCKTHSYPEVMKIDVEGFEAHVLEGAEQVLEQGYPKKLFLEVHPSKIRDYDRTLQHIFDLLNRYEYSCTLLEDHRDRDTNMSELKADDIVDVDNTMVVCER